MYTIKDNCCLTNKGKIFVSQANGRSEEDAGVGVIVKK
jgi:hypothetical protein